MADADSEGAAAAPQAEAQAQPPVEDAAQEEAEMEPPKSKKQRVGGEQEDKEAEAQEDGAGATDAAPAAAGAAAGGAAVAPGGSSSHSNGNGNGGSVVLPAGWVEQMSRSTGRPYYFHARTGKTQWTVPTDADTPAPPPPAPSAAAAPPPAAATGGGRGEGAGALGGTAAGAGAGAGASGTKPQVRVAIIVPFRDLEVEQKRSEHLAKFVPHMTHMLGTQLKLAEFHVYIVEQSKDQRKFNRGKLLNIGFELAKDTHDIFIFHDVDLLPQADVAPWYKAIPSRPIHIAKCWDRYTNNPGYFGGIVSFSKADFIAINGFPNNFWGWGGEDDELYKRVKAVGLKPTAPPGGTIVDLEQMSLTAKLAFLHEHTDWKCNVKRELLKEHEATWRQNGLSNLQYSVLSTTPLNPHASRVLVDVLPNGHWSDDIETWQEYERLKNTSK